MAAPRRAAAAMLGALLRGARPGPGPGWAAALGWGQREAGPGARGRDGAERSWERDGAERAGAGAGLGGRRPAWGRPRLLWARGRAALPGGAAGRRARGGTEAAPVLLSPSWQPPGAGRAGVRQAGAEKESR